MTFQNLFQVGDWFIWSMQTFVFLSPVASSANFLEGFHELLLPSHSLFTSFKVELGKRVFLYAVFSFLRSYSAFSISFPSLPQCTFFNCPFVNCQTLNSEFVREGGSGERESDVRAHINPSQTISSSNETSNTLKYLVTLS